MNSQLDLEHEFNVLCRCFFVLSWQPLKPHRGGSEDR